MTISRTLALASAATLAAALLVTGCQSGTPSAAASSAAAPTATPAATPAAPPQMSGEGKPPVPVAAPKPPTASLTHMMTKDEPYFDSQPGTDAKSLGTLSKGTKLLLLVPGMPYSKVLTEDGATVYVMTDGIDPIPAKK